MKTLIFIKATIHVLIEWLYSPLPHYVSLSVEQFSYFEDTIQSLFDTCIFAIRS